MLYLISGSGLVLDWEQESGMLLASGDVRIIRVWDTQRELKLQVRQRSTSDTMCTCYVRFMGTKFSKSVKYNRFVVSIKCSKNLMSCGKMCILVGVERKRSK